MPHPTSPAKSLLSEIARAWPVALITALGLAVPGFALAGVAGVLTTTVMTLSPIVTYATVSKSGEPLVTYAGYAFSTSYSGTNTTNNVRLEGVIAATDPAELVTLDTANSPSFCRTEPLDGAVKLICDIGQVRSGSPVIEFEVFFKVPQKVINGVADDEGKDQLKLTGTTLYAEVSDGAGNTNNSSAWTRPMPETDPMSGTDPLPVALGTINTTKIKSVLPKSGGKLYSGNGGVASADDRFATSVVVGDFSARYRYTNTTIDETEIASCLNTILNDGNCYELALTIVDEYRDTAKFDNPLVITLTIDRDASKGVNPSKLTITYDGEPVGLCPAKDVALENQPCLNGTPVRVRDNKNPDINGDIRVNILNYSNGSYKIL